MGEPSPHGDSPTVGTEPHQNEYGSIPFGDDILSDNNFSVLLGVSERNESGFPRDDIPQSLDSIMKINLPVSGIPENVGSAMANSNDTENFDSIISDFSFDDIIELYDSDNNHIFDFPENERIVNHQDNFSNSVNSLNETRNNTLSPIAPENALPSPSQDLNEMDETWKVGSNPVDWSIFDGEMSSTYMMGHTDLTAGHAIPFFLSPDTTLEGVSESNMLCSTSENTTILSEDRVRELLYLDPEDNVTKKDKTSLPSMEANTSPLEPSPHESSSIFKAQLVPTASNQPIQVDNSVLDTGLTLPDTFNQFIQSSRSARINVPITYQQTNKVYQTVCLNTSVPVTYQQTNQFNQFAVYPGTTIPDTSQQTSQSSQIATGVTAPMSATSHQTNQPEMYHSTSVSDASTTVTSTSCQSSQSSPSVMNANINQSNGFNQPIIGAGTILPCTSSPSNQLGLSSACLFGREGASGMNMAIVPCVILLPAQDPFDRSPMHTNWDSLGVLQDQGTNPSNKCFLDEKKRKRRERMRIASKKNREKNKKKNMSMEAKERELSKENVKLKEEVERLKKKIEELKIKLGSKKD